ncbi:MAG: phosphoglucosamine mutase, partial [Bacteroidales bacterium]|nr:phosphoglucosamine mutase [Bacteroidales bacterium]
YHISKNKIELKKGMNPDEVLKKLENHFVNEKTNTTDGLKIDFEGEWLHLRKSNTEPIIRIYAESSTPEKADALAKKAMGLISKI